MICDNTLTSFPRLFGERDDALRINRAIQATPNGILDIPRGDYEIYSPIVINNRCSLQMHPAARLIAKAEMDFVVTYDANGDFHALTLFNEDGSVYDNLGLFISGGDIDGAGLASCLMITNAHHYTLSNISLHNGRTYGLRIGGHDGHIYELVCNNVYCKCTMKGLSGNIGIYSDRADAHFTDCFVVDYTTGMRMDGAANRLTRCHIWGGTIPPSNIALSDWSSIYGRRKRQLYGGVYGDAEHVEKISVGTPEMLVGSVAFYMKGCRNVLDGCYADTAEIGYLIEASTVITNSGFFNNSLMELKKSTAICHRGGTLRVSNCDFTATVGTEKLYEGSGENVLWSSNVLEGFDRSNCPDGLWG